MAGIVTTVRAEPRIPWSTVGVSVALTLVPLTVFLRGDPAARQILLALAALAIGAYAATIHPLSIFAAFAVVLGAAPYSDIPGSDIPVVLTLAVGVWVALIFVPGVQFRPGWCELVVFALAATALLSVLATGLSDRRFWSTSRGRRPRQWSCRCDPCPRQRAWRWRACSRGARLRHPPSAWS